MTIRILAGSDWQGGTATLSGKLRLTGNGSFFSDQISWEQIVKAQIVTNENYSSVGRSLGWGIVGDLAFGPPGMAVGVLAGGRKSRIMVAVEFADHRSVLLQGSPKEMSPFLSADMNRRRIETTGIALPAPKP